MWADVIPGILTAAIVLLAPGTVVLLSCRVRPVTAVVAAPAASLAVLAVSALAAWAAGIRWEALWVVGTALVCALVGAALTFLTPWGRRQRPIAILGPAAAAQYLAGQVVATVVMAPLYLGALVSPTSIAQRYDNAFHLNAIEAIVRTGDATPMATGAISRGTLYPNGWHTLAALVQELSGLELAPSVQALTLTTVLGVWPLAMWLLLETLVRPSPVTRLLAGPLLLAFPGFPLVLLDWGLVYPTILGLAAAPALAAAMVHLLRERTLATAPLPTAALIGLSGVGVGIAHPGSALSALLLSLPLVLAALVVQVRGLTRRRPGAAAAGADSTLPRSRDEVLWAVALALLAATICVLWVTLTPGTSTAPWTRFETAPQATGEILTGAVMGRRIVPLIAALTAFGVLCTVLHRTRDRWPLLALLVPAAVYFASASMQDGPLRDLLSGYFYRDNYRTAAALTAATVPVAAAGIDLLVRGGAGLLSRLGPARAPREQPAARGEADVASSAPPAPPRRPGTGSRVVALALTAVVGLGGGAALSTHVADHPTTREQFEKVRGAYRDWELADLLSPDEREMFEVLPQFVPADGFVIADPWEGGGLTYAFGGRDVNQMYVMIARSPEEEHFDAHFREIAENPQMCEILPQDRPLFYLDLDDHRLGGNEVHFEGYFGYQGITADTPGFEEVHRIGEVTLYRLTAC